MCDFLMGLPKHLRLWFFNNYLDSFSLHCLQRAYCHDTRMFHDEYHDEFHFRNMLWESYHEHYLDEGLKFLRTVTKVISVFILCELPTHTCVICLHPR